MRTSLFHIGLTLADIRLTNEVLTTQLSPSKFVVAEYVQNLWRKHSAGELETIFGPAPSIKAAASHILNKIKVQRSYIGQSIKKMTGPFYPPAANLFTLQL